MLAPSALCQVVRAHRGTFRYAPIARDDWPAVRCRLELAGAEYIALPTGTVLWHVLATGSFPTALVGRPPVAIDGLVASAVLTVFLRRCPDLAGVRLSENWAQRAGRLAPRLLTPA
jgi:hypothetical protein